jgi:hypothetical protein
MHEHLPRGGHEAQSAAEAVVDAHPAAVAAALALELSRDTGGQLQPRYVFVPRPAGRLALGEFVIEPALGPVRVAAVMRARDAFTHVTWTDDHGPSRATGRYPADRSFPVRAPEHADRLLIRQGVDQAAWARRDITGAIARLIAAHLHLGPRSALYDFTVNGEVTDHLYDELNQISTSWEPYRPWASALGRYCLSREDTGPVPGWGPHPEDAKPRAVSTIEKHSQQQRPRTKAKIRPLTAKKRMPTETAMQLIEAAYALGVAAGRSGITGTDARHAIGDTA